MENFDRLKNSIEIFDRLKNSIDFLNRFALFRLDFSSDFLPKKRAIVFQLMLVICYINLKLVHLATASLLYVHSFGDLFLENPKQNINSI